MRWYMRMTGRGADGRIRRRTRSRKARTSDTLARAQRNNHRIRLIDRIEIGRVELFDRKALQKCCRGEDVPVPFDHHRLGTKHLTEQGVQRRGRERPEPRLAPFAPIDLADAGCRDQHHAAGRKRAVDAGDRERGRRKSAAASA